VGEHAVERALDAPRELIQHAQRAGAQQDVQADGEHAPFTTLQGVAQSLGIFEGHLAFWVCQASAAHIDQPGGLQLDQLVTEQLDDGGRLERMDMDAELNGLFEFDPRSQPAGADRARVTGDGHHARELIFEAQVVARNLHRRRRQQIRHRAPAEREAAFVCGQRLHLVGMRSGRTTRDTQHVLLRFHMAVGSRRANAERGVVV
jgi:hypothetical protein